MEKRARQTSRIPGDKLLSFIDEVESHAEDENPTLGSSQSGTPAVEFYTRESTQQSEGTRAKGRSQTVRVLPETTRELSPVRRTREICDEEDDDYGFEEEKQDSSGAGSSGCYETAMSCVPLSIE